MGRAAGGGRNNAFRRLYPCVSTIPPFSAPPSALTVCSVFWSPRPKQGYPPYNIERTDENNYRVTLAVAGFAEKDLVGRGQGRRADRHRQARDRDERQASLSALSGHRRPRLRAQLPACRACRGQGARGSRTACSMSIWSASCRKKRSRAESRSTRRTLATIEGAKAA